MSSAVCCNKVLVQSNPVEVYAGKQRFYIKRHKSVVVRYLYGLDSIKFSVDCSLWSDASVSGFKVLAKCLDSWYVGDPENETMGLIGVCGLRSLGSL